jgi:uncharacterized membrane protein
VVATTTYQPRIDPVNLGSTERWLTMVAGGMLAAWGLTRRDTIGAAAAVGAAALLYRGGTGHSRVYQALGVNHRRRRSNGAAADRNSDTRQQLGGRRGILVEESITINRPASDLFRFWRNFENLPQFMRHLESVAVREGGISHWVARGPANLSVEWDARIINEVDNQLIGWQSLEGSTIATAGSVHFDTTEHGTRVRVRLQYNPPGGRLGAAVARLFGEEPNQTIREDLRRFKRLIETGEIPTTEGQPSGRRSMRMGVGR